jgi:hypothetical protein
MRERKRRSSVGIFKEMHEQREVSSVHDYRNLRRMLSEAISRGCVEQIPVIKPHPLAPHREWYRDKETGQIYSLDPPDERGDWWTEVDMDDLIEPGRKVQ